ncbi:hypothetical protein FHW96_001766 [Novosphingobium sp. SG751A]|nr:hypothetical protein [Novosphingobium sp. SG751A]
MIASIDWRTSATDVESRRRPTVEAENISTTQV